jgi:archaellum component FlaC
MKQELIKISKEAKPLIQQLEGLKIKDEKSLTLATELLSQANTLIKASKEERKSKTAPLEQQIDEIEIQYTPTEDALSSLIKKIRADMGTYQTEAVKIREAKEDAISNRVGDGKGKFKAETAISKIEELDKPVGKVKTQSGSLSFRADKILKITDQTKIPRGYMLPDESRILSDLKKGINIPGCEIEVIQVPINRRS